MDCDNHYSGETDDEYLAEPDDDYLAEPDDDYHAETDFGYHAETDHESSGAGCSNKAYVVLTETDIMHRLDEDIKNICSAINVSRGAARILLTNFKWNIDDVIDAWFADQEHARKNVGLLQDSASKAMCSAKGVNKFTCSICYSDYSGSSMISAECDHLFCKDCYKSYVELKIVDGHDCVRIKCPEPKCGAAVLDDVIETLVSDEFKKRFYFYVVRSYIEEKKNIKWCPSPGCDYAIEFELGSEDYDVKCDCAYMFCWNCVEESHSPVDCKTVEAWLEKNEDVTSSSLWIFAYTKPCPKCKKSIEKNKGCMHMTCPKPCGHNFCWTCLGDWKDHNQSYYRCNAYTGRKNNSGVGSEADKRTAAKLLERYSHYYERYALNHNSRDKAKENLKDWKSKNIQEVLVKLGEKTGQVNPTTELQFITEAWLQIIECRRVLKWTYAYAFYMDEEEIGKKNFFEGLQGDAEAYLEGLHHCAEKDLEDYLNSGGENHACREKLIRLTKTTKNYFANLVRALENGLKEVEDQSVRRKQRKKDHAYGASSSTNGYEAEDDYGGWDCQHCTYYNHNPDTEDCEICALPRRGAQ